jgi:cation transport ATPase
MTTYTDEMRATDLEAASIRYLAHTEEQSREWSRAARRFAIYTVITVLLIGAAWFILPLLVEDAVWCVEQWGVHERALNCMVVEGTFTGKMFVPEIPLG